MKKENLKKWAHFFFGLLFIGLSASRFFSDLGGAKERHLMMVDVSGSVLEYVKKNDTWPASWDDLREMKHKEGNLSWHWHSGYEEMKSVVDIDFQFDEDNYDLSERYFRPIRLKCLGSTNLTALRDDDLFWVHRDIFDYLEERRLSNER